MNNIELTPTLSKQIVAQYVTLYAKEVVLRALAAIPGTPTETIAFAILWTVFLAWQIFALNLSGAISSGVELALIGIQAMVIGVLFTKLLIWVRMQTNVYANS